MRDQYAGDVSDLLKFALLRTLVGTDRTLGVAWYYVPGDDGRPDGRHLEWRHEVAWQQLDGPLFAGLSTLSERSVAALEKAAIWPKGTLFHREPMPPSQQRKKWAVAKRATLNVANIVFLDPDNGLGAETPKHMTSSEIRHLRQPGRAIVFITFPGRKPHDILVRELHETLHLETETDTVVTLRTNVSVPSSAGSRSFVQRQRWFTLIDPDAELVARARAFAGALTSVPRVRARLNVLAEGLHT